MYAPIDPSADGLRPGYRSGFWGGPGVADMKGNVGATRANDNSTADLQNANKRQSTVIVSGFGSYIAPLQKW
jgi:hypothetical protein